MSRVLSAQVSTPVQLPFLTGSSAYTSSHFRADTWLFITALKRYTSISDQFGFVCNTVWIWWELFFRYRWQRRIKPFEFADFLLVCVGYSENQELLAQFLLLSNKAKISFFPFLAFNAENIWIMEAMWLNILCFGKDSLTWEVSFNCCVLRICHWSEEKGTEKELQIADFCTARIVSDKPGLTVGCSASAAWQGATVPWPCRLHGCHLYRSPWPHRCGYKWRQIVCQTLRPSHTQPFTAGIKDGS